MDKTIKLYDRDAYATEFDASVISCQVVKKNEKQYYEVILNQTLFFPEEGGQTPDAGTLSGIAVVDVQIEKDVIIHTLEKPLKEQSEVHGCIDWNHRFSNMQQHSGEHIFSGLVHQTFGYDNVGFHLSDQVVTMDFNGALSVEQATQMEEMANQKIVANLPIVVTFPSKEELAKLEYRSKIEIDGQVRIVTIPGVDVCACCAPHVKLTGEIGMLKIMSMQNYKGGVRISILCGFRALEEYRTKMSILSETSNLLSVNQEMLPDAVRKLKQVNQDLKVELTNVKRDTIMKKLETIGPEQEHVYLFENNLDAQIMRDAVNKMMTRHTGVCAIFNGEDETGYQFIIGSSYTDVREVMSVLKEKTGARGGGSASMVQGSVAVCQSELRKVLP